ncbi:hypothetical protein GCM10007962_12130 [Yeosuana aromativorans]|uniref:Lipoprotein n=1 Tax=Yeosuana aromativorans TaxID=288019 RepID=A0A8J3BGE3_9FLAO|nr:hypothetical protein [Yeosuana aromativorans]GGK19632.1 hypothetical protein GCM10007962_12130 [Yeosuana aromativorans]
MKTVFKFTLLFVILFALSCTTESTAPVLDGSDAANLLSKSATNKNANAKRVTRPINTNLESDPDPNTDNPCGESLFYGNVTHMGKVTGYTDGSDCHWTEAGTLISSGHEVTIAANGDELWSDGSIEITFPTDGSNIATIEGGSTIVGGTGRFEGATGWFIFENMIYNLDTFHESHTAYGEITY